MKINCGLHQTFYRKIIHRTQLPPQNQSIYKKFLHQPLMQMKSFLKKTVSITQTQFDFCFSVMQNDLTLDLTFYCIFLSNYFHHVYFHITVSNLIP